MAEYADLSNSLKYKKGDEPWLVAMAKVMALFYFMKRHGHLYAQMISRENLENAFDRAKRGKTWQRVVQEAIAHR